MSGATKPGDVAYVFVQKKLAAADPRLNSPENKGRKVLAVAHREGRTVPIPSPHWMPPAEGAPSWILATGPGGLEVATFNENTIQERHKHERATEIYQVLHGQMEIEVADETVTLEQGDEVIVLPGTCHQVRRTGSFVARVHTVNCHGDADKRPC